LVTPVIAMATRWTRLVFAEVLVLLTKTMTEFAMMSMRV
jgi:hypothetical protein